MHIPFCKSKCTYCDFLSFSGMENAYAQYVTVLLDEIRASDIKSITSVYIGGGTPTALPACLMQDLLSCIAGLPLQSRSEVSIEVNPGTLTKDYLQLLISNGVNRLSFGLQTTCDCLLSSIRRIHTFEQFLDNYRAASEHGFDNINIDLMFGLPGQTLVSFKDTLSKILTLEPQHISFYSLSICEDTPLWNDLSAGRVLLPCDDVDRNMYHFASKFLSDNGYLHYEISNAAKPGYECAHNVDCWQHKPYIGFGLGAHSFDGQRRWSNQSSFSGYFSRVKPDVVLLSNEELISEAMILGLRMLGGVDELLFMSKHGVKPSLFFEVQIRRLIVDGLLQCDNNRIRLTPLGLDLANQVFMQFL